MYSVEFNDQNCLNYKILPVRRPNIPSPAMRYERITVSGRDGTLIESDGCYEPVTISVEFNFMTTPEEWAYTFRAAKRWLTGSGKLKFADDQNYYYKCLICIIADTERTTKKLGKFTAEFLCEPYMYEVSGDYALEDNNNIINTHMVSHPDYVISGSGSCTLTVNGKIMQAVVNGTLTINTDLMIAYNADGTSQNSILTGEYEDLYFVEGENIVSISEGFILKIIPHWRCL